MMNKNTFKTKTFWGSLAGLVGAAGAYATGEMTLVQALPFAFQAVLTVLLRDGLITATK